ncbi:MAG TPA: hypothetical protein VKU91_08345 [Acidimicrobiales bacterium]|nr:hypothetical protein [Acidimicrobiales bacterium]
MVALAYWVVLDRGLWFYGDEWDFILRRGFHHPALSIWVAHNEHWSTLPILLWRGLYSAVHLRSYWPYLLPLLAAHLVVVHLIWRRCLRAGADPWLATAVAAMLGLYGPGWEDLAWAFQIGFVGALMFGLLALDAVDGGAPTWRRDATASLLAVAALMCSAVGDAMLVALAASLVRRRRWERAVAVLVPPVAAELWWWLAVGHRSLQTMHDSFGVNVLAGLPAYAGKQVLNMFGSGFLIVGIAVTVSVGAWAVAHLKRLIVEHPEVVGLAGAALAFYLLAGVGRDRLGVATPSRYTYVGAVCMAPLVALALSGMSATARRYWPRRRFPARAALGLVAAFTAADVVIGAVFVAQHTRFVLREKRQIVTSAALVAAGQPWLNRYPFPSSGAYAGYLTPPDLVRLLRRGRLPAVAPPTGAQLLYDVSWLDVGGVASASGAARFALTGASPGALRAGPGCAAVAGRPGRYGVMRLTPRANGPAAFVLRGRPGSEIVLSLAPGGAPVPPKLAASDGQFFKMNAAGRVAIRDIYPGADLLVSLPAGAPSRVCGLAG